MSPAPVIVPSRNPMDELCPSPIARTLMRNRTLPGLTIVWSGCSTMLGLHSAAPSRAYSLVKVAPSSSRRAGESRHSESSRSASSSACRRNVSVRSWWRPLNRASTSSRLRRTSSSSSANTRCSTAEAREAWWSNPSCPGTNRRVTTRDLSAAICTGLRRARSDESAFIPGHPRKTAPAAVSRGGPVSTPCPG